MSLRLFFCLITNFFSLFINKIKLAATEKQIRVIVVSSLFIVTRDLYSLLLRFSQTEDVFERIASTVTTPSEINSRSSFIIRDE